MGKRQRSEEDRVWTNLELRDRLPGVNSTSSATTIGMNNPTPLPADIDVLSVKKMQEEVLLDVREPEEFATATIEGSLQIPMRTIPSRLADLEPHRGERIVVHCHHGGRSARVAQWLRDQGFEQVQNMAGGIDAWSQQVDPTVPRY